MESDKLRVVLDRLCEDRVLTQHAYSQLEQLEEYATKYVEKETQLNIIKHGSRFYCPKCDRNLVWMSKYCDECGQKLNLESYGD